MDTELRHTCGFKLRWTDIAQGLMQPLPIVEHLNILRDDIPRFRLILKFVSVVTSLVISN